MDSGFQAAHRRRAWCTLARWAWPLLPASTIACSAPSEASLHAEGAEHRAGNALSSTILEGRPPEHYRRDAEPGLDAACEAINTCYRGAPVVVRVRARFDTDGQATNVKLEEPRAVLRDFIASCVESRFRHARIGPLPDGPITVEKPCIVGQAESWECPPGGECTAVPAPEIPIRPMPRW
ncbi:hypothetical protein [Pendulispora albinea]|uniref:Uncharacterized protein n=1 Tax=Pendulispora albinea TaxID=2741071 RepID=A0ABZ2M1M7_9BACT